jgi:ABC-2 type transport system permease protein
MSPLVAGELVKLRTTRTALGFAAAAVLLVVAVVLITTLAGDPTTVEDKRGAINFGGVLSLPLLIFGIVGATGEYRHRTLAPGLLVAPDRARLDVARMIAYALAALVVGVLMLVVAFGIGIPLLGGAEGPDLGGSDYLEIAVGGVLAAGLCAMLGVGIGILVRNQVAAVVGALVWFFIIEPLLPLIDEGIADYTISGAAGALGGGGQGVEGLGFAAAGLVLVAWTAVFMAAGVLVNRRRDVD